MKFKMNDREWEIKEVSQEEMFAWYKEEGTGYYYGQTHFSTQEIWLSNELSNEQKRKTLYHELMHCYIRMFITMQDLEYNEESLCDISANSHDIIHKIVKEYFKEK